VKIRIWYTLPGIPGSMVLDIEVESMDDAVIKKALRKEIDEVMSQDLLDRLQHTNPTIFLIQEEPFIKITY